MKLSPFLLCGAITVTAVVLVRHRVHGKGTVDSFVHTMSITSPNRLQTNLRKCSGYKVYDSIVTTRNPSSPASLRHRDSVKKAVQNEAMRVAFEII